ncbi:MAG TPA: AMP-binding protein, partial [Chondromyces sp.]|nr:AMP-binding protein [Chondromyces sp.]
MNITSTYEHFEQTHPEKVAIRTENGEITFQEWARLVRQAVTWFQSKKSKNRRVAIVAENTLGSLVAIAGAARAGWTAIPIDPRWTVGEVQERVKMVHPDVLFAGNQLDLVIEVSFEQINSWLSHIKALEESKECVRDAALPFYIGFTSGSTGNPKAFIRSHQSWIESFHCNISDFEMTRDEVVLIPGTIFHSLFLYGALSALYLGQTIYFMRKFIPEKAARVLHDFPITAMYAVPTMFQGLMKQGLKIVKPISFISSGAKWEDHAKEEMVRLFPEGRLYEFYGASETSYITVLTPEHLAEKPGSVGKACKGV